jgi:hypothetical protein
LLAICCCGMLAAVHTPDSIRAALAHNLAIARGDRHLIGSHESGVHYTSISRMEARRTKHAKLTSLYLLANFYDCRLQSVLSPAPVLQHDAEISRWDLATPPLPVIDARLRTGLRAARKAKGLGTPKLSASSGVDQAWIVRLELGGVLFDVIRAHLLAQALGLELVSLLEEPWQTTE